MLNHALRVPFCIAPPSHCVHGQILIDKSRIRNFCSSFPQDLDQKSGALNRSFFLRGLFLHKQELLWLSMHYGGHEEESFDLVVFHIGVSKKVF